ncbi:hypothetical protein PUN28_017979 [Cardiocondyla obscurior]|uniref:Uncharacterized protein n=1 Tax=Cardiocondyla obscurior TaxID=286306 RepID=A0AAW2EL70_9HYME
MNQQEKCRELFGSLSEDSDSLPASPPPGAWPPPVDPGRRRRVPRKGTEIQRGDSSRDRHTSWLMEILPAPPKAGRKSATTGQSGLKGKTASGRITTADMATPGGSATAMPASGSQEKMADRQPPRAKGRTTSGSGAKIKPPRDNTSGQPGITDPVRTAANRPAEGKASGSGQKPTKDRQVAESATKKPALPPGMKRGPAIRRGPVIRSVQVIRPPATDIKTVASITLTKGSSPAPPPPPPPEAKRVDHRETASTVASTRLPSNQAARPPDVPATPPATSPSAVPLIVPPPTPPAYLRRDGWISKPGIPLAVPIQLPDGTCISVPMSAIRHNRKWRARTATGRWILRFATNGRLTMCRKVTEVTLD